MASSALSTAAETKHSDGITARAAQVVAAQTATSLPPHATSPSWTKYFKAKLALTLWWTWVCIKIGFASTLVIGLLVAYGLRFSVITIGPFTLGLYGVHPFYECFIPSLTHSFYLGVIILADFIVQTTCAYLNRIKVVKISKEGEKRGDAPLDISIAVVGYREDSEAWKKCLRSLQKQDAPPKAIIGVVDGQDGPDQSMAADFVEAFPPNTVLIGDFPELLSKLYTTTYWANIPEEFHSKAWKARGARLMRSIANTRTPVELEAEKIAWKAIHDKLDEWNEQFKIDQYKAICFTQPHGHKRVSCFLFPFFICPDCKHQHQTAMFTAFSIAMHIFKTKDAVFTTDSDTLLDPSALRHMSYLLASNEDFGGVTGDVKIWNKKESWLALMCALRYWFAVSQAF